MVNIILNICIETCLKKLDLTSDSQYALRNVRKRQKNQDRRKYID